MSLSNREKILLGILLLLLVNGLMFPLIINPLYSKVNSKHEELVNLQQLKEEKDLVVNNANKFTSKNSELEDTIDRLSEQIYSNITQSDIDEALVRTLSNLNVVWNNVNISAEQVATVDDQPLEHILKHTVSLNIKLSNDQMINVLNEIQNMNQYLQVNSYTVSTVDLNNQRTINIIFDYYTLLNKK